MATTNDNRAVTGAGDFGEAVCKALGLDPGSTSDVIIRIPGDGVVTVTVEMLLFNEKADGLVEVLKRYKVYSLVPLDAD